MSVCPKCGSASHHQSADSTSTLATQCLIKGNPAERSAAIDLAAMMLDAADSILLAGIGCLDMDSQVAAWQLADRLHATIDISWSRSDRAKLVSMAKYGKVTSTYGEVSQRGDIIVCWFSDPVDEAKCVWDLMTQKRRSEIKVVVVAETSNATAEQADCFFQVDRDRAEVFLAALRGHCQGLPEMAGMFGMRDENALSESQWKAAEQLAGWMTAAKYGALLFPSAKSESDLDLETESLTLLVRQLNATVPFVAQSIANDNRGGASYVLASMGGYSSAINFNRGYPRYLDLAYSANTMLQQGHCDLAVAFTSADTTPEEVELINRRQANIQLIEVGVACCDDTCLGKEAGIPRLTQADIFLPVVACSVQGQSRRLRGDGAMLQTSTPLDDPSLSCESMLQQLFAKAKDPAV